jgi:hypothetical protein
MYSSSASASISIPGNFDANYALAPFDQRQHKSRERRAGQKRRRVQSRRGVRCASPAELSVGLINSFVGANIKT